jgi:tetratricopeptide (TPR) repeat protein
MRGARYWFRARRAPAGGASFLLDRTAKRRRKQPDDAEQAQRLAVALGRLALALEQAGAMIEANRYSFAQYLEEWRSRHDHVLAWYDERVMQCRMSVAVTWQTSVDQLTEPGRRLLRLLAWLAPDPIPESLLGVPVPDGEWGEGDAPTDLRRALADLEAYSLVTRADDAPMFVVHRLVQDVTRRSLRGDAGRYALAASLRWVNDALTGDPQDARSWPTLEPLAPHALVCAQFADEAGLADPTARVLNMLGVLYRARALHSVAEMVLRRALAIDEAALGPSHPTTAMRLNNLAQVLQAMNRLTEAEPLVRRAIAIAEASGGPDDPRVAVGLGNLAELLRAKNHLSEAEPLTRRALAIDEASYGPDHPDVARDLYNLVQLLAATSRLPEAVPLVRRAAAILVEVTRATGRRHPQLQAAANSYAGILMQTGSTYEEAQAVLREVGHGLLGDGEA